MDNQPVVWVKAFDEALGDGFNALQARFYADAVVRMVAVSQGVESHAG